MRRRIVFLVPATLVLLLVAGPAWACGGLVNANGSVTLVRTTTLGVNTLHHQVLATLGHGVRVVARNEDGHVEGVEVDGAPNVLAVQWHPELLRHRPEHLALFAQLVGADRA